MSSCTRRELLTASVAGGILAGCTRKGPQRTVPGETLVSISRHPGYTQHLYDDLRRVLAEYRLHVAGKRVLLKPNLVEFEPARPIHTHPLVVHAALEAFRAMGAQVLIGEGPGHRRDTLDLAEAAGYFNVIPRFEEIFVDLNLDRPIEVPLRHAYSRLDAIYLAQTARSCDLLVSLPKMKTHHWAGVTLSMKNLFGTVPGGVYGWPKNLLHWAGIPECVADLYRIQPQSFAIVDGIVGMEGNGPIDGTEKPAGVVVAGRNLAAVDASCCQIMAIDPCRVKYLQLAVGDVANLVAHIRHIGEPVARTKSHFALLPEWESLRA